MLDFVARLKWALIRSGVWRRSLLIDDAYVTGDGNACGAGLALGRCAAVCNEAPAARVYATSVLLCMRVM